ncbi:HNH endonuclease family protein [Umezawaea beigongshangensis]|uniref:HNH endonuclease family protein n=1 Tax=Umezawaea beigongshangensis TaxID=2780383 RepID=UPI0027DAFD79|nr:HNH endonuclease family protein [Umezawaea beigongshangensis]
MKYERIAAFASAVAVLSAVVSCSELGGAPPSGSAPAPGVPAGDAVAQLAALPVAAEGKMTGYSRDRFPHWSSRGEGCDTREVVLQQQGRDVVRGEGCKATSGEWTSPYDGVVVTDAGDVDIDHVVPLAEAWRSGAADWTDERREQFANDLDGPQLVAATAKSNRTKGDQDPAKWKPPVQEYWCTYAVNWVQVKSTYGLSVDQAEKDALAGVLKGC